eukprot:9440512-Lingulodinium_polyedra.AAC.1
MTAAEDAQLALRLPPSNEHRKRNGRLTFPPLHKLVCRNFPSLESMHRLAHASATPLFSR